MTGLNFRALGHGETVVDTFMVTLTDEKTHNDNALVNLYNNHNTIKRALYIHKSTSFTYHFAIPEHAKSQSCHS